MANRTGAAPGGTGLGSWIDTRIHASDLIPALLRVNIPIQAKTFYFGGITLFLFGVQVVTGTLLALYYKPTPDAAYDSVKMITSDVTFGWLIRSVHHWAANLMIIFMVLHLLRIFFQAAYKYPRELTWLIGGGLLGITVAFGFTGYLLPWDQKAFWATTVGTEIAGSVPIIGEALLRLLRGGMDVTDATLSRFFGIHILVLPLALGGLLVVHLTLVHEQGLANPKRSERRSGAALAREGAVEAPDLVGAAIGGTVAGNAADAVINAEAEGEEIGKEKTLPFFPNYMLDEVIAWYAILAILVVLASVFPVGVEAKANALETPAHIKPEWYFLSVYELLKLVPRLVGVMTPILGMGVVILLPLLDRNPEVRARRRPIAIFLALAILVAMVVLTAWGLQ